LQISRRTAENHHNQFPQGLKPVGSRAFTSSLAPTPPAKTSSSEQHSSDSRKSRNTMRQIRTNATGGGRLKGRTSLAASITTSIATPAGRLIIVAVLALLWMSAICGRLAYLQLVRHSDYMARALRQQQRTIEISPKRGVIYDRNMNPLAMSIQVDSAFAVPNEIADVGLASRLLGGVLNVPRDVMTARLGSSGTFVWIQRKLAAEQA